MTHPGVWLALVDGEHARFVTHDGNGFHTVQTEASDSTGKRTAELVTDRLGRSFESAGSARHAIAPHSDPHAREKDRFAERIAEKLNEAAARGLFASLVLAGPPHTLQAIENALDPDVRRKVTGQVAKTLAKVPDRDLGEHFPAWPLVL